MSDELRDAGRSWIQKHMWPILAVSGIIIVVLVLYVLIRP